jgi:hypothetical protein
MATTRPDQPDSELPHTAPAGRQRSLRFVVNPLVSHVRAHQQSALDFVVDRFKRHRVTSIGEEHGPHFSTHIPTGRIRENGCVRMFIYDLLIALHAAQDARLRYFVVEWDEERLAERFRERFGGDWRTSTTIPPNIVNRKAYWFAEILQNVNPAYAAIFRVIQSIPPSELEVVGIDYRTGDLAYGDPNGFLASLNGDDLPNGTPEERETRRQKLEDRQRRYRELSDEREAFAAKNFRTMVLDRLGDDRALIYYGANHLREGLGDSRGHYYSGFTNRPFVRRIIEDGALSSDDIYSIYSVFAGTTRGLRTLGDEDLGPEVAHEVDFVRIFDVLRAEFPDEHSLGFDVDNAHHALHPSDGRTQYPISERYDGCIYFRDLNNWNGQTRPPAASTAERANPPDLSITDVIPARAEPGNTVFIYGFVLTANTQVTMVTRGADGSEVRVPFSDVVCMNENLIRAQVPMAASVPGMRQGATVQLTRQPNLTAELRSAFRYMIPLDAPASSVV